MSMLLEVRNITKSFGGLMALQELSLGVREGEILGLIGPNGSGKTTFFNVISSFLTPDRGQVIFAGKDITGEKPHVVTALGLARTFQHPKPLLELTTHENIRIAAFLKARREKEAAEAAWKILELIGLDKVGNVPSHKLTFGQKKILEVGRALATRPKMICLDEVMAGLNWNESLEVIQLLRKIHQEGITLILIEHNMSAILEISKRILVLNYGMKIADGNPNEVIESKEVVEAYLGKEEIEW
jgi:branched-chain amino acid transport system ATP-binding protein